MGGFMSTQAAIATQTLPDEVSRKNELLYVQLARELAMDIQSIDKILAARQITNEEFENIKQNPRFQSIYSRMVDEWESSLNTAERVRIKALSFVEEAMPEYFARAHDPREALPAKVEILKAVSKIAGIEKREDAAGGGEKFSVTINISDTKLEFEKQPVTIDVQDR